MERVGKKQVCCFFILAACIVESYIAYKSFGDIDPFPVNEFFFQVFDHVLRECLLAAIVSLLYYRRKRVPDRIFRYVPVIIIGILYIADAFFMISQLSLDRGLQTTLSVLAGINNNIFLVLMAAMCYHKWPNIWMKLLYFAVYLFSALTIVFDGFYFWQTSMHVESVLFQNLNIYAVKGIFATMSNTLTAAVFAGVLITILLFYVPVPQKRKPNFAWSLLCVAMFTIGLNITDRLLGYLGMYGVENLIGMYVEVENEKTRMNYRNMLSVPINVNFISKAMFDTDKLAGAQHVELRELTARDKTRLTELGIDVPKPTVIKKKPQYDRIVLLILESMHRDFINYYNSNIPEEATSFLNSLIIRYPHMNRYYTSSVPTTQGLNATFRSHIIMDKDIPGKNTPSLFRCVQDAGMRGIFMNASSQYYANELREYPEQFGMKEYYAKEYLEKQGYTGASGWGYHNDVMYEETIKLLENAKDRNERLLMVTKTLDMHQPYPYTGFSWGEMPENVRSNEYITVRGIYWVDRTLKQFFDEAKRRGLMDDRTLFIITSDHNPHSGGEYTKLVTKAEDKQSIAPIPLIFISKNLTPLDNLHINDYASQIDLAPTLLYLLGLSVPDKFMGRNLLQHTDIPYALGYFGGKAYYWSAERHFVDQMDKPVPDSEYEDALTNYIVHNYGLWHQ